MRCPAERARLRTVGLAAFLRRTASLACVAGVLAGCATGPPALDPRLARIGHVVVIYAENHSFDNMYGLFSGANGIAQATPQQYTQLDHDGTPLPELVVFGRDGKPDPAFPRLPNAPFRIDAPPVSRPPSTLVPNPMHAYFHHREQINGGANNLFAAMSSAGGWVMGYYDGSQFRLWQWAKQYTLADNFFAGAFGGSYLNHQYLVCACAPRHADAPPAMRARLDANGKLEKRPGSPSARKGAVQVVSIGRVTADGWSVNTEQPSYQPSGIPPAADGPLALADAAGTRGFGVPLPPQTATTIGDTLSAKGIPWAWYAGGWRAAVADGTQPRDAKRSVIYTRGPGLPNFQPHHQPFDYYASFAPGTQQRRQHLLDGDDFMQAIARGTLPAVSFYKPAGVDTQHPAYTDIMTGDEHIDGVLRKLRASPQWSDMLVIVTYDENGGYWDHVPPPSGAGWGDRWGPGTRIPTLLIGPTVKRGFVDSTPYDTGSILKFITERFGLQPLAGVRARMGDLANALVP